MTGVYLLHYDKPLHHARHYMGCSPNISERVDKHAKGTSRARLPEVFRGLGISFVLSRTWETDTVKEAYLLERKLKSYKNNVRSCRICNPLKGTK